MFVDGHSRLESSRATHVLSVACCNNAVQRPAWYDSHCLLYVSPVGVRGQVVAAVCCHVHAVWSYSASNLRSVVGCWRRQPANDHAPPPCYTWPGSSWRPSACWADVIATRPQVLLLLWACAWVLSKQRRRSQVPRCRARSTASDCASACCCTQGGDLQVGCPPRQAGALPVAGQSHKQGALCV